MKKKSMKKWKKTLESWKVVMMHIKEGLDHASLLVITRKYPSKYRKHRYELVDEPNRQNVFAWRFSNKSNNELQNR